MCYSPRRFLSSIRAIARNPYVTTHVGIGKHVLWQIRKILNLFPFEQRFSRSRIIASSNSGVSAVINNQDLYDPNNMRLLRESLNEPGRVFFDVGANIGSYTLLASEQPAHVFAFEPHPVTFQLLKNNVELNDRSNVELFCLALGSENRESFLTDQADSSVNQIVKSSEKRAIKIHCRRADSLIRAIEIVPEILKIDTEEYEYEVLEGFGSYLAQIDLLFIEIRKNREAVVKKLLENGLRGPYSLNFSRKVFFSPGRELSEDLIFLSDREMDSLASQEYYFQ